MLTLIVTEAEGGGRLEVIFTFLFMHENDFHLCITFIARQNNKAISILKKICMRRIVMTRKGIV